MTSVRSRPERSVAFEPAPAASRLYPSETKGASVAEVQSGEMKRSLTLTGITVNAMALIAPGAFLWTTFASQSALSKGGVSTAGEMWTGLLFSLILALLTAYSYAQLAK